MTVLDCTDMTRSLAFYTEKLGFSASTWGEPPTFAILQRGMVTIALAKVAPGTAAVSRNWAAYIYVEGVDRLHSELAAQGTQLPDPPTDQFYNCRDFVVTDPDGHMLSFGEVKTPDPLGPGLSARIGRDESSPPALPTGPLTGGCQCGAIRVRVEGLGRPSFCHCRMCQKAFGATGGALVTAKGLAWTRGEVRHFKSSSIARRGFCADCGTPLTFEYDGGIDIAIAAFDRAAEIAPVVQYSPEAALPWTGSVTTLPGYPEAEHERRQAWFASVRSLQHPDHDTAAWRPSTTESKP
jgi:uncharacterized glyoxalase superfamily protein PhnB